MRRGRGVPLGEVGAGGVHRVRHGVSPGCGGGRGGPQGEARAGGVPQGEAWGEIPGCRVRQGDPQGALGGRGYPRVRHRVDWGSRRVLRPRQLGSHRWCLQVPGVGMCPAQGEKPSL